MSKNQPEYQLQCLIAEYLRRQYPRVMFLSDVRASLKLTIPQQVRSKKIQADGFACPDMMIFHSHKYYHGMFLELKAVSPYLKGGGFKTDLHIRRQAATIRHLQDHGYYAAFCWDFDDAKKTIDWYLKEAVGR